MKILFKDMSEETKKIINKNKMFQTFPSGVYFQRFLKEEVKTPMGLIKCSKESLYDGGMCIGSTLRYTVN